MNREEKNEKIINDEAMVKLMKPLVKPCLHIELDGVENIDFYRAKEVLPKNFKWGQNVSSQDLVAF